MNIFFLDKDPVNAARYHCDKHVIKMITETCQIISTAIRIHYNKSSYSGMPIDLYHFPQPYSYLYKPTHIHHPSIRWAEKKWDNMVWLITLGRNLLKEYDRRYGKDLDSFIRARQILNGYLKNVEYNNKTKITSPPLVMPDDYKIRIDNVNDVVSAYRKYYFTEKKHLAEWAGNRKPEWYNLNFIEEII